MAVTRIPADVLFRVFTACQGDPPTLVLDVRPQKEFKKKHIAGAYSIRLAANGQALLDYSKSSYNLSWSKDCWWDKHIVIYGEEKLKKEHPVVAFLAKDGHSKSVNIYADGLEIFEKQYPFLITASVKEGSKRRYPGEIIPHLLYLGDWDHASDAESLGHLNVKRILTIHNNPENLKPPAKIKHMRVVLADVETEDVSKYFNDSYTFIEAAKAAKEAVLVHCGAGVSRSAALCIAYLMRKFTWPAARARAHCVQRRSVVLPNDGFWRSLCAFESQLGIQQRSDPTAVTGFSGMDAPAKLTEGAAGEKVVVKFVSIQQLRAEEAARAAQAVETNQSPRIENGARRDSTREAERSRRDKHGSPNHVRDRERERNREEAHVRRRSRSADRRRGRSRSRDRRSIRDHSRERHRRGTDSEEQRCDRDEGRGRRRSRSPRRDGERALERQSGRKRDRSPGRSNGLRSEKPDKRQRSEAAELHTEVEAQTADRPAPVILESIKEGKIFSRLEIGLLNEHQRCVFGRLPSNEVVLEHLSISRQHAQLTIDPAGDLFITDLGSAHRTNVDGVWIRPNQPRPLPKDSIFKLGGSTREFKVLMTPRARAREEAKQKLDAEMQAALAETQKGIQLA